VCFLEFQLVEMEAEGVGLLFCLSEVGLGEGAQFFGGDGIVRDIEF
jgi:hypothetical protein